MLGAIKCVTISTKDADRSESLYRDYLGYRTVSRRTVGDAAARSWGAPRAAGEREIVMQPESGEATFVRLVDGGATADYTPLLTCGWNSFELIVQDVKALNDRLARSPFRIIGAPAPLAIEGLDMIVAMQAIGPDDEVLYLTEIGAPVPGFELPAAMSFVGRPFISVLGGLSLPAMTGFFKDALGASEGPPMDAVVSIINKAYGLADNHRIALASILLPRACVIEIDELPSTAVARPRRKGQLPPGNAMTSFEHADLDAVEAALVTPPETQDHAPYFGARTATVVGAAGELIELIETKP